MIKAQQLQQLDERGVLARLNHSQDHRPLGRDAMREHVMASRLRDNDARLPEYRNPADCGSNPDLDLRRCRVAR